jgi:hypothetical protein
MDDMGGYGSAVSIAAIVVTVQPGLTDWLTAVGTVAVAVVAVGVALFAEWRAGKRVQAEREHSAKVLADERTYAAGVLADERNAADARLARQLEASEAQLRGEREHARREQQEADAWAVQVRFVMWPATVPGEGEQGGVDARRLLVVVTNLSARTVTRVEGRFSPDGVGVIPHWEVNYLRGDRPRSEALTDMSGYGDILTPGVAVQIESDAVPASQVAGPFPIVRWTDAWGQRWEHRRGEIRQVGVDEPWVA